MIEMIGEVLGVLAMVVLGILGIIALLFILMCFLMIFSREWAIIQIIEMDDLLKNRDTGEQPVILVVEEQETGD